MTPLGCEARAEPRRLGRVLRGPPRRGLPGPVVETTEGPHPVARREAEEVELLIPILLPDPVLLPLSAAVTFSSLAASSSLLAPARSALVSSSCVVMGKMSIIIIIRS